MLLTSYAQQLALFSCLFVLRTMITRSALVVLHDFTSAERVLNVGRLLQVCIPKLFSSYKIWAHPIHVALLIFHRAVLPLPNFQIMRLSQEKPLFQRRYTYLTGEDILTLSEKYILSKK